MLPNSNANNVIANVSVSAMNNPNMDDKEFNNLISKEVRNEYVKMRTSNKSVVFGGNTKYDDVINKYSMMYNVDPLLIKSIIKHESGFNPQARSGAGAGGLMQLMPATAKQVGVNNVYDPKQNIAGGIKYFAQQLENFNGNTALALAAYNAGAGNVKKYGNKVPPFKETQKYVRSILNTYSGIKG
jgi:soluble lytic murein transglycosylase-like protein